MVLPPGQSLWEAEWGGQPGELEPPGQSPITQTELMTVTLGQRTAPGQSHSATKLGVFLCERRSRPELNNAELP